MTCRQKKTLQEEKASKRTCEPSSPAWLASPRSRGAYARTKTGSGIEQKLRNVLILLI